MVCPCMKKRQQRKAKNTCSIRGIGGKNNFRQAVTEIICKLFNCQCTINIILNEGL